MSQYNRHTIVFACIDIARVSCEENPKQREDDGQQLRLLQNGIEVEGDVLGFLLSDLNLLWWFCGLVDGASFQTCYSSNSRIWSLLDDIEYMDAFNTQFVLLLAGLVKCDVDRTCLFYQLCNAVEA